MGIRIPSTILFGEESFFSSLLKKGPFAASWNSEPYAMQRGAKIGLYGYRWKEPFTAFLDNYTLGASYSAVDPAAFKSSP